jgi:hypothetical protein
VEVVVLLLFSRRRAWFQGLSERFQKENSTYFQKHKRKQYASLEQLLIQSTFSDVILQGLKAKGESTKE